MTKDIRVVIVEDDPYSRDFMAMLLARDWRTHVAAVFDSRAETELKSFLEQPANRVDVLIIDTEVPVDPRQPGRVAQTAQAVKRPPKVLYTCTRPDPAFLEHAFDDHCGGCIVKGEILYALAAAVTATAEGRCVVTPGVQEALSRTNRPKNLLVMDGTTPVARFTPRETDLARLGLLFNLGQRDIADELVVSTDFVSEVMGHIYEKLGLHDILSGETELESFFSDETLLARCRAILANSKDASGKPLHKAPWLSTIAFHLLTSPSSEES